MVTLDQDQLLIDGQHVPLLSGEFQFWRVDPAYWEKCLRQIKAMGLPIVATYLNWRRHCPTPDRFDFAGETDPRLNVRKLLDLCVEIGLWVHIKPGPWICAEESNGGYPEWLISQPELQVLDSENRVVRGYVLPFDSPIPSYLHPAYLEHVRRWMQAVDDTIHNYVYPQGPIILLQIDNEPCWTFHDRFLESDYNPVALDNYRQWLRQKYQTLERLIATHGIAYPDFAAVDAPRHIVSKEQTCRLLDWVAFKEWTIAEHITRIRQMHEQNGINDLIFTVNYNLHDPVAVPADWHRLDTITGLSGFDYYPFPVLDFANFADMALGTAYSQAVCKVPWSPEIMSGVWHLPGIEPPPITPQHIEYLYLLTLAFGLKGMNFYMLVNRENWEDAPIDERGDLTAASYLPQQVIRLMTEIPGYARLKKVQRVGLLYYRPYAREAYIAAGEQGAASVPDYDQFRTLYHALLRLNCDPGIVDPWANPEQIHEYRVVFVPSTRNLDADAQRLLREYARRGGILVICNESEFSVENSIQWVDAPGMNAPELVTRLQGVLKTYQAIAPVQSETPEILTILHENDKVQVLFVLNTGADLANVQLAFEQASSWLLYEVLTEQGINIASGKAIVPMAPRSARVFVVSSDGEGEPRL